jgi:hypothetical protein
MAAWLSVVLVHSCACVYVCVCVCVCPLLCFCAGPCAWTRAQVGVPKQVACILTFPERVTDRNIEKMRAAVANGPVYPGARNVRLANGFIKNLECVLHHTALQLVKKIYALSIAEVQLSRSACM